MNNTTHSLANPLCSSLLIIFLFCLSTMSTILSAAAPDYRPSFESEKHFFEKGAVDDLSANISDPPVASFTASSTSGPAPLDVDFSAISSTDSDGNIVSYAWDFGDGNFGTGVLASNTFSTEGEYTVSLVVTDNDGDVSVPFTQVITVTAPQNPPVLDPIGDLSVTEGDVSVITLTASDADAGDQITYFVNPTLPGFATFVDNGDRTATLTLAPQAGDAMSYGNFTFTITDGNTFVDETVSLTVIAGVNSCSPISLLPCEDIEVALPYNLSFDGTEGGLEDRDFSETGFTMVTAPSVNQFPAVPTNANVPGLEADLIDVLNGQLTITTTKGISLEKPPSGTNNNTQVNTLGVGFQTVGSVFDVAVDLEQPDFSQSANNGQQQAGLWFGLDEDNYVKLVLEKVSDAGQRIRLLVETIDPNDNTAVTINEITSVGLNTMTASNIRLRLEIDPVYQSVRGFYTLDNGVEALVGVNSVDSLSLPQVLLDGVDHDANGSTPALSFAGVMASHFRAAETEVLDASFDNFVIEVQPFVPTLILSPNDLDISLVEGATPVVQLVDVFTNDGTVPTITLSDDPHSGDWLIIPSSPVIGELMFDFQPDLTPGVYNTTIIAMADGYVSGELSIGLVVSSPDDTPTIIGTIPTNGEQNVPLNTSISANELLIPNDLNGVFGVDNATITNQTVKLFKVSSGTEIPATVNGSGGGDAISLTPIIPLEINTLYRFEVEGVKDLTGVAFETFSSTFTTAADNTGSGNALDNVSFTNAGNVATDGMYTSLEVGPDGKFYGLQIGGNIDRWTIDPDGRLSEKETITTLTSIYGSRSAIGLSFDPDATASNLIVYISHSEGVLNNAQPWDGKISRLTGALLETEDLVVTQLPRSRRDHLTNSITFRPGENDVLYFNVGSNSAGGAPDNSWGNRLERLLTAATLRLDLAQLPESDWPLDAKTTMNLNAINNVDVNSPTLGTGTGTYNESGSNFPDDGTYNPYYVNAPLTIFATGIRNAYDLVWHSNGQLYVPTNGTAGGSNTPASVDGARRPDGVLYDHDDPSNDYPVIPATFANNTQRDFLFRIDPTQPIGYYGHPNPTRGEFVLNRGPVDVNNYPTNVAPDVNFQGVAFDFQFNKSPNGVIEYRSNAEGGNLQGALLVCRYSGGSDIIALVPNGPNGDILTTKIGIPGFTGFGDPLDITEDPLTGNLYVSDFQRQTIVLLKPSAQASPEPFVQITPEEVITDDIVGFGPGGNITVFITNTGNAPLDNPVAELSGPNADEFTVDASSMPATLGANSSTSVVLNFDPLNIGPKFAVLTVSGDNGNAASIDLKGLGKEGLGGTREPSLQHILDTYEFAIDVNDQDNSTNIIDLPNGQTYNDLLGDELVGQLFQRATDAPVTVEVLAVYGPESADPIVGFGWYQEGNPNTTEELFTVRNNVSRNGQTLNPIVTGILEFDPGGSTFGFYNRWPFFNNRILYSEDELNTFSGSIPHHVRVYEVPGVDNTYIIATEEHTSGFDYQDIVVLVRNVEPLPFVPTPAIAATPLELYPEGRYGIQGYFRDTASVIISNPGTDDLEITDIQFGGANGTYLSLYSGPASTTIAPASSQQYEIIFDPEANVLDYGYRPAEMIFSTNTEEGTFVVPVHAMKKKGLGGSHEPPLQDVVNTLGIGIDVGWTTRESDTELELKGEEVLAPLFEAANPGDVGIVAVGRYSPRELLPFGWYTNVDELVTLHEVGSLSATGYKDHQTLFPPLETGGESFDPQGQFFGIYTSSVTFNRVNYTEDNLNTDGVERRARVYPVKDRQGVLVPNSYMVTFEDAMNGDYQDYIFVLTNVKPYVPPTPSLVFTPDNVELIARQGDISEGQNTLLDVNSPLNGDPVTLVASEPWVILPTAFIVGDSLAISFNASGLASGIHRAQVIANTANLASDTLEVLAVVTDEIEGAVKINFQDDSFFPPTGYFADEGAAYGARIGDFTYGWLDPFTGNSSDNFDGARGDERGITSSSSDQEKLLRSFNHFDLLSQSTPHDWELAVNNGLYIVRLAAGDPDDITGRHTVRAEGKVMIDDFIPTSVGYFQIATDTIRISDGKLTLDDVGAPANGNTKLLFVEVSPVDSSDFTPEIMVEVTGNEEGVDSYYGLATVNLMAIDRAGSGGIGALRYRVNGGEYVIYDGPFSLGIQNSSTTNYSIDIDATDFFGNVGTSSTSFTVVPATGAIVRLENMTKFPNTDRGFPADDYYSFNRILGPFDSRGDTVLTHDNNIMRIHNDGTGLLMINELTTTGTQDFVITDIEIPEAGLAVQPGNYVDAVVRTVTVGGTGRLVTQYLVMGSNADNANEVQATFRSAIQTRPEGSNELNSELIFNTFGFTTKMGRDNAGGIIAFPGSDYPTDEQVDSGSEGDMVLSPYLVQADPNEPVQMIRLAAFHGPGGAVSVLADSSFRSAGRMGFNHGNRMHQSILPKRSNTSSIIAGDEAARITVPFLNSIARYRTTGGNTNQQFEDEILGVRMYRVVDRDGNTVPNHYLYIQDYIGNGCDNGGGNCDFNDNIDYIVNARPVAVPTTDGIDDLSVEILVPITYDISTFFDKGYGGNRLLYSATLADGGALADWMSIDENSGIISIDAPFEVAGGSFDVTVTVTDYNLLTAASTFTVNVLETTIDCEVNANNDGLPKTIDCVNPSIELSGFVSTGNYQWTGPNGFSSNNQNPLVSVAGTYTLASNGVDDNCPLTSSVLVSAGQAAPILTIVAPLRTLDCTVGEVDLTAIADDGGATFQWFDDLNQPLTTAAKLTVMDAGTYRVVVTNSLGCTNEGSIVVTENLEQHFAGNGGFMNICGADPVTTLYQLLATLGGNPQSGGTWTLNGNEVNNTINPSTAVSGQYIYTVGGANGCAIDMAELTLTVDVPSFYYLDIDLDGFGDPNSVIEACTLPNGYVTNNDDTCPNIGSPDLTDTDGDGMGDICDDDDDNDGVNDNLDCDPLNADIKGLTTYYADFDGDGFGDPNNSISTCDAPPANFILNNTDNCPLNSNPDQSDIDMDGKGDACDPSPLGRTVFWLEAECAEYGSNWLLGNNSDASNGSYMIANANSLVEAPADLPENRLRFVIENVEGGTYHLFGRVLAANSGDDSFWVRFNGGSWVKWTDEIAFGPDLNWFRVVNSPLELPDGTNFIDFAFREAGTILDKLHLNIDGARPTDLGPIATNCGEITNVLPVAVANATPRFGAAPLTVTLNGVSSSDSDGFVVGYDWDWGVGTASGIFPQIILPEGDYDVTLTVTDDRGDTAMDIVSIEVFDGEADTDNDGVLDQDDNCIDVFNPNQELSTFYADLDGDGLGDPNGFIEDCEMPPGYVTNTDDNCPTIYSFDLRDSDGDGEGDVCDTDDDNDGVADDEDCDPLNDQISVQTTFYADLDGDGFGDPANSIMACFAPEGYVVDNTDNCPETANAEQLDADSDGIGNACDASPIGATSFWLEAECGIVGTGFSTVTDENASEDAYVVFISGNSYGGPPADLPENRIRFVIDNVQPGTYNLFARASASNGSNDSYYVRVNDGEWTRWNVPISSTFDWSEVTGSPHVMIDGVNIVDFAYREDGTLLDKIHLNTTGVLPTATGDAASNCDEAPNVAPVALATADPLSGFGPLTVQFDASGSSDSDGLIVSYEWNWGTGSTSGITPEVIFPEGTYTVTLTVTDDDGASNSDVVDRNINVLLGF